MGLDLLLADEDRHSAAALHADLLAFGHRITLTRDGRAALMAIDRAAFDAVILNLAMPAMDGIAVLRHLRAGRMNLPIIILGEGQRAVDRIQALDAGADDYLVKPASAVELNARLNALLRGRLWALAGDDTLRAGDIVVSPGKFRAWRGGSPIELGNLEFRLLAELARNAGCVLTRAVLLERVWGYESEPATNIVDAYVRRLRVKLNAAGGEDRIATVRGVGYMLRD